MASDGIHQGWLQGPRQRNRPAGGRAACRQWLRRGLVLIVLAGTGIALAGGGRIEVRKLGVIPPARDFCVMDGSLYAYDWDEDVLVRYEEGSDGKLSPGKVVARVPFVPTRLGCGHGRIVGWCGRQGIEGRGLEWVAATGEMRQFQWPPGEVVSVGVLPDGVLALTKRRLIRWQVGEDWGTAVVLYEAVRKGEVLGPMVVDPAGTRVAMHVFDRESGVQEDRGGGQVLVLELRGGRANFVAQYAKRGALEALANGVLWEWDPNTCGRGKRPQDISWRFYPPALLARDWKTGRFLGLWEESVREYGKVRSDGKRVIAVAKPYGAAEAHPANVYEVLLDVDVHEGADGRKECSTSNGATPESQREPGREAP